MTKRLWAMVIGSMIVMFVAAGVVIYGKLGGFVDTGTVDTETKAVNFTVYESDGTKVDFSDFEGEPVVINFWASWCEPCQREMPLMEDAYKEYGDKIQFMMIDFTGANGETQEKGEAYLKEKGYTFPVYFDNDSSAARAYKVMNIPLTYFVNDEGVIVKQMTGLMDEAAVQEGIDAILE